MRLVKIGDTDILINPVAIVFAVALCLCGFSEMVLAYVFALLIHEGAHLLIGGVLHIRTAKLELTPFGGVATVESYYHLKASHQIAVALAGPVSNFLAVLMVMSLFYLNAATAFLMVFFKANITIMLFNLLPVLPMDGGRICHAALSLKYNWRKSAQVLSFLGMTFGAALIALCGAGVVILKTFNVSLLITGCYLIYAANVSKKSVIAQCLHTVIASRARLERTGTLDVALIAASGALTVNELMAKIPIGKHIRIIVIDEKTLNEMGEIKQQDFEKAMIASPNALIATLL